MFLYFAMVSELGNSIAPDTFRHQFNEQRKEGFEVTLKSTSAEYALLHTLFELGMRLLYHPLCFIFRDLIRSWWNDAVFCIFSYIAALCFLYSHIFKARIKWNLAYGMNWECWRLKVYFKNIEDACGNLVSINFQEIMSVMSSTANWRDKMVYEFHICLSSFHINQNLRVQHFHIYDR